jgi:hypothetical protein
MHFDCAPSVLISKEAILETSKNIYTGEVFIAEKY